MRLLHAGMVLAHVARKKPQPDRQEIKEALDGNFCRCTGYVKIIDAVKLAAEKVKKMTDYINVGKNKEKVDALALAAGEPLFTDDFPSKILFI